MMVLPGNIFMIIVQFIFSLMKNDKNEFEILS